MRFVMIQVILFLSFIYIVGCANNHGQVNGVDHDDYSNLLNKYVHNGKVNYKDLKNDPKLQDYLNKLNQVNPDNFKNDKEKLAFWINTYNAFTLKAIVDHYPIKSIMDIKPAGVKDIWHKKFIKIHDKTYTLNEIEHEVIRKEFKEPRIHFVLVCAAISCPPLIPEAYFPSKLESQLETQTKLFLNNTKENRFNVYDKKASLSSLFNWYKVDFGDSDEAVLKYVAQYIPDDVADTLKKDNYSWKIEYNNYDWALNE